MFDDPAPEDVPQLSSTPVGGGLAARGAKWATEVADQAADILDKLDGPL